MVVRGVCGARGILVVRVVLFPGLVHVRIGAAERVSRVIHVAVVVVVWRGHDSAVVAREPAANSMDYTVPPSTF
jgi:hypothetical protein